MAEFESLINCENNNEDEMRSRSMLSDNASNTPPSTNGGTVSSPYTSKSANTSLNSTLSNVNMNKETFNIAITNARSLAPKINSLAAYFEEHSIAVAIVTETWLVDGPELEMGREDLENGHAIAAYYRNRPKINNRNPGLLYYTRKIR